MQLQINKEFIDKIKLLIDEKNDRQLLDIIVDLHPVDIAEVMETLAMDDAKYLYLLLEGDLASDVLIEIPEDDRKRFLAELPAEVIARQYIEYMDTDDAVDVLGELPE